MGGNCKFLYTPKSSSCRHRSRNRRSGSSRVRSSPPVRCSTSGTIFIPFAGSEAEHGSLVGEGRNRSLVMHAEAEAQQFSFEAFTRHAFFTEVNRWIVDRVIGPGRELVVDLGCGPGAVTELIVERLDPEAHVIGIDPSESALARARDAIHSKAVEFMQGSDEWVSRLVSSVDAVVFLNAIHLVPDKAQVIAEIRRALHAGGVFAFNTTFFNGAYVEGTTGFWRRGVVRAGQGLRERGVEVHRDAQAAGGRPV